MKYILSLFLSCLMYSAQAQTLFQWPKEEADMRQTSPNLAQVTYVVVALSRRLDSLTHAFQTMHDSLIEVERRTVPFIDRDRPGLHYDDGIPPIGNGIDLPGGVVTDSTLKFWREHGILLQPNSTYTTASDSTISAPKKKRRKG